MKKRFLSIVISLTLTTGIASTAFASSETNKPNDINELYKNAYAATMKSLNEKTQSSIKEAREAIDKLPKPLEWAIGEFSRQLDTVQHPIFVEIINSIEKSKNTNKQDDINNGRELIKDVIEDQYKRTWSSDLDRVQQKKIERLIQSVNTLNPANSDVLEIIEEELNDLNKVKDNNTVKNFIDTYSDQIFTKITGTKELVDKYSQIIEKKLSNEEIKQIKDCGNAEKLVSRLKESKADKNKMFKAAIYWTNSTKNVDIEKLAKEVTTYNNKQVEKVNDIEKNKKPNKINPAVIKDEVVENNSSKTDIRKEKAEKIVEQQRKTEELKIQQKEEKIKIEKEKIDIEKTQKEVQKQEEQNKEPNKINPAVIKDDVVENNSSKTDIQKENAEKIAEQQRKTEELKRQQEEEKIKIEKENIQKKDEVKRIPEQQKETEENDNLSSLFSYVKEKQNKEEEKLNKFIKEEKEKEELDIEKTQKEIQKQEEQNKEVGIKSSLLNKGIQGRGLSYQKSFLVFKMSSTRITEDQDIILAGKTIKILKGDSSSKIQDRIIKVFENDSDWESGVGYALVQEKSASIRLVSKQIKDNVDNLAVGSSEITFVQFDDTIGDAGQSEVKEKCEVVVTRTAGENQALTLNVNGYIANVNIGTVTINVSKGDSTQKIAKLIEDAFKAHDNIARIFNISLEESNSKVILTQKMAHNLGTTVEVVK